MKEKEILNVAKKLFSKIVLKNVTMLEIPKNECVLKKQYMQILQAKKNY